MFDNFFLNRNPEELTIGRALRYTLFWISTAFAFCGWIWYTHGRSGAFMWMSGYMLEWLLSFDNLFVFHLIFNLYGTPDHLKHRPLYLGICGAVLFRLLFIFVGEYMMHAMLFMHFVFGTFLVYTGIKTLTADEEDEDPSQNPMVKWLQEKVPFVNVYDNSGAFFVKVPTADDEAQQWNVPKDAEAAKLSDDKDEVTYGTVDFASYKVANTERRQKNPRGTHLQNMQLYSCHLLICKFDLMASPWPEAPHFSVLQLSDPFKEPLTSSPAFLSAALPTPVPTAVPTVATVPIVTSPPVTTRSLSNLSLRAPSSNICPACGHSNVLNSVYCTRCGHHLSETSSDGVKIRSLEAEIESLRTLHLEEVTSLKMALEKERKDKEDLRLDVEARQRVQDVGDSSLQQQRSLQTTISGQELSIQRLSQQVEDLTMKLAVSKRENELMRADLDKQSSELSVAVRRKLELETQVSKRETELVREGSEKHSAELAAAFRRIAELEKVKVEHQDHADGYDRRVQLLQAGYESHIRELQSDYERRIQELQSGYDRRIDELQFDSDSRVQELQAQKAECERRIEELQSDCKRIQQEAAGQRSAARQREQLLRGRCKLLQASCFRLWWCLKPDSGGLDVVEIANEGNVQEVEPVPQKRMPLPADWRSILQFQAQLFHSFAEACQRSKLPMGPKAGT
eukprot:symbB.v1.2.027461.t2/scaffold2821.1/size70050/7